MVKLSFGEDLLTQRDLVQENNVQKIKYRCDKGMLYVCEHGANVPRLNLIQKSAKRGVNKLCSRKLCIGNIFCKIAFLASAIGPDLKVLSINSLNGWMMQPYQRFLYQLDIGVQDITIPSIQAGPTVTPLQ